MPEPILWSLKEAAEAISVSANYLRKSDCHRVYLPSNTPHGKPLMRFKPEDVREWAEKFSTRQRLKRAS